MRRILLFLLLLPGCHRTTPEGAELTHAQCADLVRRVQRIQSEDTGGMRLVMTVGLSGGIEGCMEKGTERAHRCVLQAESISDLQTCDSLFKE